MKKNNYGIILISTLLFLLALTLLTLNALQTGLLESKMSSNYKEDISALHQAEIALNAKEKLLVQGITHLPPEVILISNTICGVNFYRVQVSITDENGINKKLQSTYAVIDDISRCSLKPEIKTGRQSWLEIT